MYQFASQQLKVTEMYKQAFAFYRVSFRHVWPLVVLGMIGLFIAQAVGYYSGIINPLKPIGETFSGFANFSIAQLVPITVLFAAIIVNLYFVSVAMYRMYVFGGGVTGSLKESLSFVFHKLPTLIFVKIIVLILILVGIFMVILPGVWLAIAFAFCTPAVLFENKHAWGAIATSFSLAWGRWWQTFAVLVIPWLLILLTAIVSSQIKDFLTVTAISLALFSVLMPLLYAFLLVQYHNLRLRKPIVQK
jgi:hypothetical protein